MQKILILMVSGGGGHLMAAKAISGALERLHDPVTTAIVDVSKSNGLRLFRRLDDLFCWMTAGGAWLWKALWWTDHHPRLIQVLSHLLAPLLARPIRRILEQHDPDLVVTVHGLANHLPLRVLRRWKGREVPFATVVADLTSAHPIWFCPEVDYCSVPTEVALARALRFGMPPDRVEVVGAPVDLAFAEFAEQVGDKRALRQRLRLDPTLPCVLVVGGGEGMGTLYDTARALATGLDHAQMIVVAGRNQTLRQRLEQTNWEIPTRVYGFVDNMPELMAASDLLVTKAGSLTLAEAFISRLPVILYGFIPFQEEGNVAYIQEHRAGTLASSPQDVARIAREWLRPGNPELQRVVANATALARPQAAAIIANRLVALIQRSASDVQPSPSGRGQLREGGVNGPRSARRGA